MLLPDQMILEDSWSDLSQFQVPPNIDLNCLNNYRIGRIRAEMYARDIAVCIIINPVSLRYAINFNSYAIFNAHIPCTYLFVSQAAPHQLHGALDPNFDSVEIKPSRAISHFYAGNDLAIYAEKFADDVLNYLSEIGTDNRRVAIESVNPSITQALIQRGLDVVDGALVTENARLIKSDDEVECIRWAIKVAEHGAKQIEMALKPGVSEVQLWGILNYTNLANFGDWHEAKMLASGPRINPWFQEASSRKIESGDLVGFDTDMVGPMGYCADLSRTFHCGPAKPSKRQKELYRFAVDEIEYNLGLVKSGVSFADYQEMAYTVPEQFQRNAYTCIIHGVGMCDEAPHLHPISRGPPPYAGQLESGMVICVESYMGAVGERDGVKLEQQVLVTDNGYEMLTNYPFEKKLLD